MENRPAKMTRNPKTKTLEIQPKALKTSKEKLWLDH